ncbi:MAG: UvrD-helicase domain-containing protein [Pseudomonadota bacterium]
MSSQGKQLSPETFQELFVVSSITVRAIITAPQYNLFVVCDPNQSIYGWRGANGSIGRLAQDYPELKEFRLSMTYRHGQNIINPSTNLIRHNHDAAGADLDSWL